MAGRWENNRFGRIARGMDRLVGKSIDVGIVRPQTHAGSSPIDMAYLYSIQDMGTAKIPKRETLKPGMESVTIESEVSALLEDILSNGNPAAFIRAVGNKSKKAVKDEMGRLRSPPLARATLEARRRRGNASTKPLIDTTQLINAIDWKES